MQDKIRKPVIWMAGDSTMQSYWEEKRPQWGWGEKVLEILEPDMKGCDCGMRREDSPFETQRRYEGKEYIVDNCAMSGRSTKTFREDGRLDDIASHIQPGDYLIIQFGHNDGAKSKAERYVSLQDFKGSLENYVKVATDHQATPILISSIVLCPCEETQSGEAGEISSLLPEYGAVMEEYSRELNIPYIDMNEKCRKFVSTLTKEAAEEMYLADHVHLKEKGASAYACLIAEELKCILADRK